jgi:hypothetical protein
MEVAKKVSWKNPIISPKSKKSASNPKKVLASVDVLGVLWSHWRTTRWGEKGERT